MDQKTNNPLFAILLALAALWLFQGGKLPFGPQPVEPGVVVSDEGTAAAYASVVKGPAAKEDLTYWAAYLDAIADKIERDGRQASPRIHDRHSLDDLLLAGNTLHVNGELNVKYPGFGDITADSLAKDVPEDAGELSPEERQKVVRILRANAAGARKAAG